MLNRKRNILRSLIFCLVLTGLFCGNTYARDVNGVTVTDFNTGLAYGQHIDHFTSFNPTSTSYVYNEAGGTLTTDGEVDITGIVGPKTLVISVSLLGSTSLDFRLEGKVSTVMSTWANIHTKNIAASSTIDTSIPITEYWTSYRLGVKVNTNGTDIINCSTSVVTHK
jgi:hypothetical protein